MRPLPELLEFLTETMSMTEIYQPVIIRYLLEQDGEASRTDLAMVLSGYDESVQTYYQQILMRWPKITLTKHDVVNYDRKEQAFLLNFNLSNHTLIQAAKEICEQKIEAWIEKRAFKGGSSSKLASKRYRILKAARGQCELCGISAKLSPIDIDHIIPQSKANKKQRVYKDEEWIHVDDERNLQALCFRCNRAKRDTDATDFRLPNQKLVRDFIPELIIKDGREPIVEKVQGERLKRELFEKLVEEHAELLADKNIEEVVDLIEVALAIAKTMGYSEDATLKILQEKRFEKGGFEKGIYLKAVN